MLYITTWDAFARQYLGQQDVFPLITNTMNSSYYVNDKVFIKVQTDPNNTDYILHDAIVNAQIQNVASISKPWHVPMLGHFSCPIKYLNSQLTLVRSKENSTNLCPAIACHAIKEATCIHHDIDSAFSFNVASDDAERVLKYNALFLFFRQLIEFGVATGFSHHDMHVGNVLWDASTKCYKLIDYGRAHIPYVPIAIEQSVKRAFNEVHIKYFDGYNYNDPHILTISNKDLAYKGMYVLNDIGGLCHVIFKRLYNDVGGLNDRVTALFELIISDTNEDVKQDLIQQCLDITGGEDCVSEYALYVGLVWLHGVKAINEQVVSSNANKIIGQPLITNDTTFCYVNASPFVGDDLHDYYKQFYKFMEPLIDRWKRKTIQSGGTIYGVGLNPINPAITTKRSPLKNINRSLYMTEPTTKNGSSKQIQATPPAWLNDYIKIKSDIGSNPDLTAMMTGPVVRSKTNKMPTDALFLNMRRTNNESDLRQYVAKAFNQLAKPKNKIQVHNKEPQEGSASLRKLARVEYVVKTEKNTSRRYVIKSRLKWYLDEHRGQYRYAEGHSETKDKIYMRRAEHDGNKKYKKSSKAALLV